MTNSKRLPALFTAFFFSTISHGQTLHRFDAVEPHMGTLFRIEVYAPDQQTAQAGFDDAFARIKQLDNILSDYQADSELSRITRTAVATSVPISPDLFRVLDSAQRMAAETDGAFDITIGPLTHLWRQARSQHQLPSADAIAAARDHCGYSKMHLAPASRSVSFDQSDMLLDAGGIAKGDAADEALAILKKLGLNSALVAASGDLAFGDAPPGSKGWEIGVDSYDHADKPFTQILMLANAAVSTSGSAEQNLRLGGKTYSHIIDPKTGFGLTQDLTVTTVAPSGLLADPSATAISVLGVQKGIAFADRKPGLAVYVLTPMSSGGHSVESSLFRKLTHNYIKETAQTIAH